MQEGRDGDTLGKGRADELTECRGNYEVVERAQPSGVQQRRRGSSGQQQRTCYNEGLGRRELSGGGNQ
jgi:hypothetical protein